MHTRRSITFPWHPSLLLRIATSHSQVATAHIQLSAPMRTPKYPKKRTQLHVGIKSYDIGTYVTLPAYSNFNQSVFGAATGQITDGQFLFPPVFQMLTDSNDR
jgi:hypothetical protein